MLIIHLQIVFPMYNKKSLFIFLFFLFQIGIKVNAQYSKTHYIDPAPWYYFDQTNELIVSTSSKTPLNVAVKSSNGILITTLSVVQGKLFNLSNTKYNCRNIQKKVIYLSKD